MKVSQRKHVQAPAKESPRPGQPTPLTVVNRAAPSSSHAHAGGGEAAANAPAPRPPAYDFGRVPMHPKTPAALQAKLTVSSPGDVHEEEADRIAERVVSAAEPHTPGESQPQAHELTQTLAPTLQRQAGPGGGQAATPNYTLPQLIQIFSQRWQDRFTEGIDGSVFDREYNDPNAVSQTAPNLQSGGQEPSWTVTFVVNGECIFMRAVQDGTQIVNHYQRCKFESVTPLTPWFVQTSGQIFVDGTDKFDFGSALFSKFYTDLDVGFEVNTPHVIPSLIQITVDGPNNALNVKRATAIKDDLVKRKMNPNRVQIQFGGSAGTGLILIQGARAD